MSPSTTPRARSTTPRPLATGSQLTSTTALNSHLSTLHSTLKTMSGTIFTWEDAAALVPPTRHISSPTPDELCELGLGLSPVCTWAQEDDAADILTQELFAAIAADAILKCTDCGNPCTGDNFDADIMRNAVYCELCVAKWKKSSKSSKKKRKRASEDESCFTCLRPLEDPVRQERCNTCRAKNARAVTDDPDSDSDISTDVLECYESLGFADLLGGPIPENSVRASQPPQKKRRVRFAC